MLRMLLILSLGACAHDSVSRPPAQPQQPAVATTPGQPGSGQAALMHDHAIGCTAGNFGPRLRTPPCTQH